MTGGKVSSSKPSPGDLDMTVRPALAISYSVLHIPLQKEGSTNPSAVRIRDNQRRSRARHKEYVEGLQKKLQDYERRGVEATLEMQQAARSVAVENSRLKILLGYHGITNDDVE